MKEKERLLIFFILCILSVFILLFFNGCSEDKIKIDFGFVSCESTMSEIQYMVCNKEIIINEMENKSENDIEDFCNFMFINMYSDRLSDSPCS